MSEEHGNEEALIEDEESTEIHVQVSRITQGDSYGVLVRVMQGSISNDEMIELMLTVVACGLARRVQDEQLEGEGICDLLDGVWNTLADMIDAAAEVGPKH